MTYTFICNKCSRVYDSDMSIRQLEIMRELGYSDSLSCPECGSREASKLIVHPIGAIYKGDGFTKSSKED